MLKEKNVPYRYRDYKEEPLSEAELRKLLKMLGVPARDLLRKNDPAYTDLRLTGREPDAVVIEHMVKHPTLLTRPIGIEGSRAVLGRPPEKLLALA